MTDYEFIIQPIAILFAIATAFHDAPAVKHFENFGVSNKEMAQFHRYNWWLKFLFCFAASVSGFPKLPAMIFIGLISALWIMLVFDIALNIRRGKKWHYISWNNANGRAWIRWFWKSAGQVKAILLTILIAATNFIYLKLF